VVWLAMLASGVSRGQAQQRELSGDPPLIMRDLASSGLLPCSGRSSPAPLPGFRQDQLIVTSGYSSPVSAATGGASELVSASGFSAGAGSRG
jgi:hypothetical protein